MYVVTLAAAITTVELCPCGGHIIVTDEVLVAQLVAPAANLGASFTAGPTAAETFGSGLAGDGEWWGLDLELLDAAREGNAEPGSPVTYV
jgi:hypothetical protein